MATLLKQGNRYHAQFYDKKRKPTRKRVALKTTTKRTAEQLLRKLEDDWVLGNFDPWIDDPFTYDKARRVEQPKTVSESLDVFLKAKASTGKSENTLRSYRDVVNLLIKHLGEDLLLQDLKTNHVESFIRSGGVSQSTVHNRYRHIRAFVNWCYKQKLTPRNPMTEAEAPERPQTLPKPINEEELGWICEAVREAYKEGRAMGYCRPRDVIWQIPLFQFAFYTGMRSSELARLRWGHIDEKKSLIYILKQKNKKQQTIPLNKRAKEVLTNVLRGTEEDYVFRSNRHERRERSVRPFTRHVSQTFRKARLRAGIKRKVTFHSLRHGFCTLLAEAGKSAIVIKEAARHADISMSMRYVHVANEHLKAELDDVFA